MKIRFFLFCLVVLGASEGAFCQNLPLQTTTVKRSWMDMMKDPSVNFYEVQKEFNRSLKRYKRQMKKKVSQTGAGELERKMPGFMQYKRWEWFTEPRVYPSGDRNVISKVMSDQWNQKGKPSNPSVLQAGNWSLLGPVNTLPSGGAGAGRVNCIAIHPTNPNILFVGAPAGGLWKSTDAGITWTTNTDNLASIGISDIAIDPLNPNNMYIATGDGDGNDNYSIGILKSTDGGNTWSTTGFSYTPSQGRQVNRLIIDPVDPNILFTGTNLGVYRSLDAGATWVRTFSVGGIMDIEFKPGNSQVIYASGTGFYRSLDGGNSFSTVTTVPGSGASASRIAIAVTPADSNYVYALAGRSSNHGFLGLYRSTDGGNSFVKQSSTPNVLGWSSIGDDTDGQAWYDLAFAASPTNKNEIFSGGVNIWRSINGGVSWSIKAHWTGTGAAYVHADIHSLVYLNANTVYAGCDGGFFRTTNSGTSWTDLSKGLQIAQMYRLGCAATDPNVVIQGWQDNGTNKWNAGTWNSIYGGDGMECFIDRTNANTMYAELYYGAFKRSFNGGGAWSDIVNGINESGGWVTPWCQDPQNPQTLYAGFRNVWKSTDQGNSWAKISSTFSGTLQALAVAPSNPNYIYASSSVLNRTTNGGATWTNIKPGLPPGGISYIAVSGTNPDKLWVTYAGNNPTNKVFKTVNGGTTWTSMLYDLPNLPVNCIVVDTSSSLEGIYIGTDLGVYYTDSTRTNWVFFSNGLPNVIVNELEIQYSSGKLRAATYGRGLWETNLHDPSSSAPMANFTGDTLAGCPGRTVQFTDISTNTPTAWNWTFPGGNPSTSTLQNPLVTYTIAGSYNDVKLAASNASGSDSITKYSYVNISPAVKPVINPSGNVTICASNKWIDPSTGASYKWIPGGQTSSQLNVVASGTYQVIVTDLFGCADTSDPVNITLEPAVPTPTITVIGDTLSCSPSSGYTYQWYMNGSAVAGATQQAIQGTPGGSYYVVITNASGCTKQSVSVLSDVKEMELPGIRINISPSPNNGNFMLDGVVEEASKISLTVLDVAGKIISERDLGTVHGNIKEKFFLQVPGGIYLLQLKTAAGNTVKKFVVE